MNAEQRVDRAAMELASRVAKRSTLSGAAAPFTPSFLRSTAAVTGAQAEQQPDGTLSSEEGIRVGNQSGLVGDETLHLHESAGHHTQQYPLISPIVATVAVASTALSTFGNMTEEQLQQLEEYLLKPPQDGDDDDDDDVVGDDERLFINDDDGMGPEEEAWLIQQMMDTDAAGSQR